MGIFDNIASKLGYTRNVTDSPSNSTENKTKLLDSGSVPGGSLSYSVVFHPGTSVTGEINTNDPLMSKVIQSQQFRGIMYDAIHFIADNVATAGYRLLDKNGDEITDHPFLDVLNDPFGEQETIGITAKDLFYTLACDIELFGNSLWLINSLSPELSQILPLNPVYIDPIVDKKTGFIEKYRFSEVNSLASEKYYSPQEIIHIQYIDPAGSKRFIWGKSPIAAHFDLIDIYNKEIALEKDAFGKAGIPTILAEVDGSKTGDASQGAMERIREMIENKFFTRKEKVAVVNAALMKITTLESKLDQLQYVGVKEMTIREFASMFRLDPMFLGLTQTTNRAQADAAIYAFKRFKLKPMLEKIEAQLNADLVHPCYGEGVTFKFDEVVDTDYETLRANLDMAFRNGACTPNEIRELLLELEPLDNPMMDKTYLGFSLAPLDEASFTQPEPQPEETIEVVDNQDTIEVTDDNDEADEADAAKSFIVIQDEEDLPRIKPITMKASRSDVARQRRQWLRLFGLAMKYSEPDYTNKLQGFFDTQINGVDKRLHDYGGKSGLVLVKAKDDEIERMLDFIMFDVDDATKQTMATMRPAIEKNLIFSSESRITAMDIPIDFDTVSPAIMDLLNTGGRARGVFKFAKEINQTTDEALRRTLTEGLRKGETIAELSERIATVKADAVGYRAVRIARTEINGGYNRAAQETVKASVEEVGGIPKKFWYTAGPAEREEHNMNEQESTMANGLPLDQPFAANGLQTPGDPSGEAGQVINCRCSLGHVIEGLGA